MSSAVIFPKYITESIAAFLTAGSFVTSDTPLNAYVNSW